MKGLVQVYTGNGKGKTTAALGLALRAAGAGKKVLLVQFLKSGKSSEIRAIKKLPRFDAKSFGRDICISRKNVSQKDFDLAGKGLAFAKKSVAGKKYDLVILDEANVALHFGLLQLKDVLQLFESRPKSTELVLTGRYAPKKLLKRADLVTEMREVKHYFKKGIQARKGIEF